MTRGGSSRKLKKGATGNATDLCAAHWYKLAVGELSGLSKAKVECRIADAPTTDAGLRRSNAPPTQFLSELEPKEVHLLAGFPLDGKVVVAEVASPHGLFMHPFASGNAHVAYELPRGYRALDGKVGMSDGLVNQSNSGLTFRIVGDGREIWKSRMLGKRSEWQDFRVQIDGVKKLELFVDCPTDNGMAHAVWIEPRLTQGGGPGKVSSEAASGKSTTSQPEKPASVTADRLVLWSCHNNVGKNMGMLSCNVELRKAGKVVWTKQAIPLEWSPDKELATTVPLPRIAFDQLRVVTAKYHDQGSALCEIEILDGETNLARGKPVSASGSWDRHSPLALVDGVRDSSHLQVGYWAGRLHEPAWVEVQFPRRRPPTARSSFCRICASETQINPNFPLSHLCPVGGVTGLHSLFMHATEYGSSRLAFDLGKKYQTLSGAAAIGDTAGSGSTSPLTFRIVGDGKELWSATLQKPGATQPIDIRVGGVSKLELFVDCPGMETWGHATWVDLELTRSGSKPTPGGSQSPR